MYESGLIACGFFAPWVYWKDVVSLVSSAADWLFRLLVAIGPERLQRIESRADAFHIGISVLNHDAFDRLRMLRSDAKANWRTVVLNINAEFL